MQHAQIKVCENRACHLAEKSCRAAAGVRGPHLVADLTRALVRRGAAGSGHRLVDDAMQHHKLGHFPTLRAFSPLLSLTVNTQGHTGQSAGVKMQLLIYTFADCESQNVEQST